MKNLSIILLITFLLISCSDNKPSNRLVKESIKKALFDRPASLLDPGFHKLLSLEKTNGILWKELYTAEFEAIFERLKDGSKGRLTGSFTFEKADNGWRIVSRGYYEYD